MGAVAVHSVRNIRTLCTDFDEILGRANPVSSTLQYHWGIFPDDPGNNPVNKPKPVIPRYVDGLA